MKRRWVVLALVALFLPQLGVLPARADSATAGDRAIGWLTGHEFDSPSLEEQLDLALAYEVGGAPRAYVEQLLDGIEFLIDAGEPADTRILGKAIVALDAASRSTTVAGRDLVEELRAQLGRPPNVRGQYAAPAEADLSYQAWGILAEARVGGSIADQTAYLLSRQCPDGRLVPVPTVNGCHPHVDGRAHAIALHALLAARDAGIDVTAQLALGVAWYDARGGAEMSARNSIPASALAWFVRPLDEVGRTGAAIEISTALAGLQITATDGRSDLLGAIGGEAPRLKQQLLADHGSPSAWLTVDALHGLRPVDLTRFFYQPGTAAAAPAPSPRIVTRSEVTAGTKVTILAQGFGSNLELAATIVGTTGTTAVATTDADGRTTLEFTARPLPDEIQRLAVRAADGVTANVDFVVLNQGVGEAVGGVHLEPESPQPMSARTAVLLAALCLAVLLVAAWLSRERI